MRCHPLIEMASNRMFSPAKRIVVHSSPPCRMFTSSARCMINPLFNLSHFSASKEAQFFSKERRIPREEYHPHLQLIRSSEVDPFAPAAGASPSVVAALKRAETGQTDMQTAYSLAISNLGQQVLMMRGEVTQAHNTLAMIHDKYKREERNSFFVMLTSVAILSFVFLKTDALEDLKDYVRTVTSPWKGFDWEWLGNPPSYKTAPQQSSNTLLTTGSPSMTTSSVTRTPLTPIEARSDHKVFTRPPSTRSTPAQSKETPESRWTLSRLFWAAPN